MTFVSARLPRLATVALTLVSLMVLPSVPSNGDAPDSTASQVTVALPGGATPVDVPADDVVAVSADIDERPVELRWHTEHGWSDWTAFAASGEHAPDLDSAELDGVDTGVSEPVWTGRTDRLQVRSPSTGELDLDLVTMAGGLDRQAGATPPSSAEALSVWPPIVPRSQWDPNGDCRPEGSHDIAPSVERIFVHHTVVFPEYAPSEGDDVVRAVCLGHTNTRGFDDVGYNFLIDRYGTIYQGREGGILQAVEGAHAQGFNRGSVGIALVGNFQEDRVPAAAAQALDQLTAWLVDLHGIDPVGHGRQVSTGGDSTKYPEGFVVDLPNIVGHRDTASNSACPGDHLYDIVRGSRPLGERVHARVVADYGWPAEGLPAHAHDHAGERDDVGVAVAPGTVPAPAPEAGAAVPPSHEPAVASVEESRTVTEGASAAPGPVASLVGRVLAAARTTARLTLSGGR